MPVAHRVIDRRTSVDRRDNVDRRRQQIPLTFADRRKGDRRATSAQAFLWQTRRGALTRL
jgi:hypothetical protein